MTTMADSKWEEKVGKHSYAGSCGPMGMGIPGAKPFQWYGSIPQETFSVGVFQWVLLKSGKGVKRGPVKVRVSGRVDDAAKIAAKAQAICELLDLGAYTGPKNVTVR